MEHFKRLGNAGIDALARGVRRIQMPNGLVGNFSEPFSIDQINMRQENCDAGIVCTFSNGEEHTFYFRRVSLMLLFANLAINGEVTLDVKETVSFVDILKQLSNMYGAKFIPTDFHTFKPPRLAKGATAAVHLLAHPDAVHFHGCITLRLQNPGY